MLKGDEKRKDREKERNEKIAAKIREPYQLVDLFAIGQASYSWLALSIYWCIYLRLHSVQREAILAFQRSLDHSSRRVSFKGRMRD